MSVPSETLPPPPPPQPPTSSTSATPTNAAEMVHYLLPHGEFLICSNAVTGSTAEACRVLTREENEISRHYGNHHDPKKVDYTECRAITRAAALAFAGAKKVAKAEEKDANPRSVVSASAKTPRDPLWFPSPAQRAALAAAPTPAAPAPAPAAPAPAPVAPAASVPAPPASAPGVAVGPAAAPGVAAPAPAAPAVAARPALPAANNPFAGVSAYNAHFNALGERIVWSSDEEEEEEEEEEDEDNDDDDDDDENEDEDEDEEMTG